MRTNCLVAFEGISDLNCPFDARYLAEDLCTDAAEAPLSPDCGFVQLRPRVSRDADDTRRDAIGVLAKRLESRVPQSPSATIWPDDAQTMCRRWRTKVNVPT